MHACKHFCIRMCVYVNKWNNGTEKHSSESSPEQSVSPQLYNNCDSKLNVVTYIGAENPIHVWCLYDLKRMAIDSMMKTLTK